IPMAVGLAAVAHPTITLFVGPSYAPGSTALAIVSIATAVTCLAPLVNSVLLSLGSTRVMMEGSIISIAGAVVAGFPLVRSTGINGAALTRAALLILGFSYAAYRLGKVHGLHIDRDALGKSCAASAAMALVVVAFELLLQNRYLLPIYIVLGAAVYLLAIKALHVFQPADIDLISNFLPPQLRGMASKIGAFLVGRA
ncbi:MAG: polysaccharide biosynthesis C-terminal domain-containing protein, partial [Candidatus Bathyarchaeia archaeon]